jgi:hypothetical protein
MDVEFPREYKGQELRDQASGYGLSYDLWKTYMILPRIEIDRKNTIIFNV